MRLEVTQIKAYERNPRRSENPEYDRIKASIQANGLDQPLIVTLLEKQGRLDSRGLEEFRALDANENFPIEQLLISGRFATEHDIAKAYSEHLFAPLFEPSPIASELRIESRTWPTVED